MPSLAILEGLIGTGCAVACLYYARLGALAGPQNQFVQPGVPWHSALGEYARRNPFAAVFGALALGFLVSSWSMYIAPRAIALPSPRSAEKLHVVTKTIPTPDPVQATRIAALQTTVDTDRATIAAQTAEIDRLKQLLVKPLRRSRRPFTTLGANPTPEGATADLNRAANPAAVTTAPASPPPSAPAQSPAAAPNNGTSAQGNPSGTPSATTQDSTAPQPH